MAHSREFWSKHVEAWRASGLTQAEYYRRHSIAKGSPGYWSSRLKGRKRPATDLVQVGQGTLRDARPSPSIELAVGGRYLLRLWAETDRDHMRQVFSVLEGGQ
jgi:hypothetical protein